MNKENFESILAQPSSVQLLYSEMLARIGEGHELIRLETPTRNKSVTLRRINLDISNTSYARVGSIHEVYADGSQKKFVILAKAEGECQAVADKTDEKVVRLLNEAQVQALITSVRSLQ